MSDTVFALATAHGRAALAVVRVSGPASAAALQAVAGSLPKPRHAALRTLSEADGSVIDRGLVLWFPGPGSATGEDCAEFHVHGGQAVVDRLTSALIDAGLRLAAPGEFTRRGFENGKLDLDQAEAVADLIDAQSDAQARQAVDQLQGALGRRYENWRAILLEVLAELEAQVDFPDEADVVAGQAREPLLALLADLDAALADAGRGRRIREGWKIAVLGAPNAGKSSLFNLLLARDAAIVTPTAGSTRDVIEARLSLRGYQAVVADMAGIHAATETIEVEGVRRARAWARDADLRVWVVDSGAGNGAWRECADLVAAGDICILNKADLPTGKDGREARRAACELGLTIRRARAVSGDDGGLMTELAARAAADLAADEFPAATRARHATLLAEARLDVARAVDALGQPELAAEDVRRAAAALARVTGRIGAEDVLDLVFSTFCIGK